MQGLCPKEGAFILSAIMVSHYDKGAYYPTGKLFLTFIFE
jgi:hypothetical protein